MGWPAGDCWLDLQSEKDYWLGTYEPELQAVLADLVQPGMVAYDVGANIGYISLLLARRVGEAGKVFAFEALPANLERLRLNLALERPGRPCQPHPGGGGGQRSPGALPGRAIGRDGQSRRLGRAARMWLTPRQWSIDGLSLDEFVYEREQPTAASGQDGYRGRRSAGPAGHGAPAG